MARLTIRSNLNDLISDVARADRRFPQVALQGIRIEQLNTFRDSQQEVPIDKGTLRASGQAPIPFRRGSIIVAPIEYTARYALVVHENPRAGRTGGVSPRGQRYRSFARVGKWKYLEHPMMRAEPGFATRMARFIMQALWR